MALPPVLADNLGLAVIAASASPLLLLSGDATIVAASCSFVRDLNFEAEAVIGHSLYAIAGGAWDLPRMRSLITGTVSVQIAVPGYEIDLEVPVLGRRRFMLNAHRLAYTGAGSGLAGMRLTLALADVTDARANTRIKNDLLRERATLLQEIQHRVANSLQIIASILMQSARTVGSEESRLHLRDAHSRVLALAELQRQLSQSTSVDVDVGPYLKQLCLSIGASMIADATRISIVTRADASCVLPNTSVSLGLIVTELVINSLKHAFPDGRPGGIMVDYRGDGHDWALTVSDDGIGMKGEADARPGLGTSIVSALARHLDAEIRVIDNAPGTRIEVVHTDAIDASAAEAPLETAV